jgi:hypothetical protein
VQSSINNSNNPRTLSITCHFGENGDIKFENLGCRSFNVYSDDSKGFMTLKLSFLSIPNHPHNVKNAGCN